MQGTAGCQGPPHSWLGHSKANSAGGSVLPGPPVGTPLLTPSSSSMISVPMEASVVHLQLLVALTAQRLCALNLQTAQGGPGQPPWDVQPWSPAPPGWAALVPSPSATGDRAVPAASGHHPASLLLQASLAEGPPSHPPAGPQR